MIEILTPGPLATVQDTGRWAHRALAVGTSGAADQGAHRLANRLVGNDADAATIEVTFGGLSIRLLAPATVALTGARCSVVERADLEWAQPLSLPANTTISLGAPARGLRSYLAVRGGIDVPVVLGSRSTDTLSGLGPAPLASGDRIRVGSAIAVDPIEIPTETQQPALPAGGRYVATVEVLPGPRIDMFVAGSWQLLTSTPWVVDPTSNRIGTRLLGPKLRRAIDHELPSEPTLPGAVQVPGNGRPIILGPDSPITGGYPVVAVVASGALDRLGQLRPGDELHLAAGGWATVPR